MWQDIARDVADRRRARRWEQNDVATAAGVALNTVQRIERGQSTAAHNLLAGGRSATEVDQLLERMFDHNGAQRKINEAPEVPRGLGAAPDGVTPVSPAVHSAAPRSTASDPEGPFSDEGSQSGPELFDGG